MVTVHPIPADAVEHNVFGYAFVTCRPPVELDRKGRDRFEQLWDLHPVEFYKMRQPGIGGLLRSGLRHS